MRLKEKERLTNIFNNLNGSAIASMQWDGDVIRSWFNSVHDGTRVQVKDYPYLRSVIWMSSMTYNLQPTQT